MSKRRVIKKYFNRRLYDTEKSRYITLEELRDMVLEGTDFLRAGGQKPMMTSRRKTLLHVFVVGGKCSANRFFSEQSLRNLIMFMRGPMRGPMSVFF